VNQHRLQTNAAASPRLAAGPRGAGVRFASRRPMSVASIAVVPVVPEPPH
jgi:hypothetical protein